MIKESYLLLMDSILAQARFQEWSGVLQWVKPKDRDKADKFHLMDMAAIFTRVTNVQVASLMFHLLAGVEAQVLL